LPQQNVQPARHCVSGVANSHALKKANLAELLKKNVVRSDL